MKVSYNITLRLTQEDRDNLDYLVDKHIKNIEVFRCGLAILREKIIKNQNKKPK